MTLLTGAALVLILIIGAGAVVLALLAFARQDGPTRAPVWVGPPLPQIEAAVRARLAALSEEPLEGHPAVLELARHHAFDMAMRGFDGEQDPEGVGLDGRHLRLHPSFVGHLRQWTCVRPAGELPEPTTLAAELVEGCGDFAQLATPAWNVLGVAVAAERGRLACCVVAGAWWATLDDQVRGDLPAVGWVVEGRVEGATRVEELAVRVAGVEATRPAVALEQADRFQLRSDEAPGSGIELRIVRGDVEGCPRPI